MTFIFRPTLLRASIAALSRMDRFSIFSRLKLSRQAWRLAISRVVETITVSMTRRLLARRDVPVSVSSTMAFTSRAFTSVAPQLNSTFTGMFLLSKYCFVTPTSSVAMIPPFRSSGRVTGDSLGTASTQRVGLPVCLLYGSSQTSTMSHPFSVIQSRPVMPASRTPSPT